MVAQKRHLTAEEYLQLSDDPGTRQELVRGELVDVPFADMVHSLVIKIVYDVLNHFVTEGKLGLVFGDGTGYLLARSPDIVRGPDVSYVAAARVRAVKGRTGYWPFGPDLAVEVISPSERPGKVRGKIRQYLAGGSRLVWVVRPATRSVTAHSLDGLVRTFGPNDELDGGDVLPGFRVRVADFFPSED